MRNLTFFRNFFELFKCYKTGIIYKLKVKSDFIMNKIVLGI